MKARKAGVWRLGISIVSLAIAMSGAAFARDAAHRGAVAAPRAVAAIDVPAHDLPAVDLPPPDLPVVQSTRDAPAMEEVNPDIAADLAPPDLPAVVVSFPREPRPPVVDVAPPDLPSVVVDQASFLDLRVMMAVRLAKGEALTHVRLGRREREAIVAFYAARDNQPVWLDGEAWTPAAKAVIARLEKTYEDGLDPNDYAVPTVAVLPLDRRDVVLADADIKLSVAVAAYARDARGARIDPTRLSKLVTPKLDLPDAGAVLANVSAAADAGAALAAYNPSHKGYLALKAKLAEIRAARPSVPQVKVPAGPNLKIGMRDPRVRLVRIRFGLGIGASEDETYDERVAAAVADFQKENGLLANGVLNRQTVLALALAGVPAARNEGDIVANMERWRWLPASLGQQYIMVNIPDFGVRLVRDGVIVHQARVIVGKPETPTPVFSNTMEHVIVNPYWHVPPSILKNEFLPRMAEDPNYAISRGYEVIQHGDKISIRQPPGEANALGRIKFMFPNQHSVYLHDTPSRSLFANGRRAYSHGCVRLDQPFRFAELVLGKDNGWSEARVRGLIGKGERLIKLAQPIPIHLAYFTTFVDDNGRLVSRDDLYGYNHRVRAALGYGG